MRALVTAFVAGFMLVLLYERIYIKVKDEVIKEELRKDRVAPLQEVLSAGMDVPAPRELPARSFEDESYPQRRTAEVKAGLGAAISSISAGISKRFEGAESEGDGNTATAPKLESAKDAKSSGSGTVAKAVNIALDK